GSVGVPTVPLVTLLVPLGDRKFVLKVLVLIVTVP
ncbi:MAG: hypothetical protein JWP41_1284, partial [Ramlibacter sp.]|nr:hypothetical protein [Ramlibacter sp.]